MNQILNKCVDEKDFIIFNGTTSAIQIDGILLGNIVAARKLHHGKRVGYLSCRT